MESDYPRYYTRVSLISSKYFKSRPDANSGIMNVAGLMAYVAEAGEWLKQLPNPDPTDPPYQMASINGVTIFFKNPADAAAFKLKFYRAEYE